MYAYAGRSDGVLSRDMAIRMLSPQIEDRGLGPVLGDDMGDLFYFLHPGANEGHRSVLIAYPSRGQGVVIMTNADNGEAFWHAMLRSVSIEYGWARDCTYLYVGITVAIVLALTGILFLHRKRARVRSVWRKSALDNDQHRRAGSNRA